MTWEPETHVSPPTISSYALQRRPEVRQAAPVRLVKIDGEYVNPAYVVRVKQRTTQIGVVTIVDLLGGGETCASRLSVDKVAAMLADVVEGGPG